MVRRSRRCVGFFAKCTATFKGVNQNAFFCLGPAAWLRVALLAENARAALGCLFKLIV